ncbi:MAG: M20/M25/M40 family metallo-hydrolase, partial [Promethearchaeota archaeon]
RVEITTIGAGTVPNMLPEELSANLDIRFPPNIKKEVILSIVDRLKESFLSRFRQKDKDLSISITVKSAIDGIRCSTNNELCRALSESILEVIGEKPVFVKKTGSTFMNNIGNHFKVPIVTYGPGVPALEHTRDEHVAKSEFLNSIIIIERCIKKLMG